MANFSPKQLRYLHWLYSQKAAGLASSAPVDVSKAKPLFTPHMERTLKWGGNKQIRRNRYFFNMGRDVAEGGLDAHGVPIDAGIARSFAEDQLVNYARTHNGEIGMQEIPAVGRRRVLDPSLTPEALNIVKSAMVQSGRPMDRPTFEALTHEVTKLEPGRPEARAFIAGVTDFNRGVRAKRFQKAQFRLIHSKAGPMVREGPAPDKRWSWGAHAQMSDAARQQQAAEDLAALHGTHAPVDTRRMLNGALSLTRKPTDWEEIGIDDFKQLSRGEQRALASKPVIEWPDTKFPMEHTRPDLPLEFILKRGDRHYYVNTEGADYPRYMSRIENFGKFAPDAALMGGTTRPKPAAPVTHPATGARITPRPGYLGSPFSATWVKSAPTSSARKRLRGERFDNQTRSFLDNRHPSLKGWGRQ